MSETPFRVVSSRKALENPFLTVREDALERGSQKGVHYVVEIPRAAVVVPVLDDGRVLLIRQYRHCVGRSLLELPAGRVAADETPETAAARELREETGFRAAQWRKLAEFFPLAGLSNHHASLFEARGLTPGPTEFDAFEDVSPEPLEPSEILHMLDRGEILDGFCQLGLLHWFRAERASEKP